MSIERVLGKNSTITVVGLSRDETKYSHIVAKFMQRVGYRIIPVNPTADVILGEKVYKSLLEIPENPGIVDVFRPSEEAFGIAKQAAEKGANAVWLQEGIINEEAKKYAEAKGIEFVQDKCIMKEYLRIHGD